MSDAAEVNYRYVRGKGWVPSNNATYKHESGIEVIGDGPMYFYEVIFPEDRTNSWWDDNYHSPVSLEEGLRLYSRSIVTCASSIRQWGWRWRLRSTHIEAKDVG